MTGRGRRRTGGVRAVAGTVRKMRWVWHSNRVLRPMLAAALCASAALAAMTYHAGVFAATQSGSAVAQAAAGAAEAADSDSDAAGAKAASGQAEQDAQTAEAAPSAEVVMPDKAKPLLPQGSVDLDQLLRLWGVFGAKVETSCASLHIGDLRCLSGHGTLAMLDRFDRPAILVLAHDGVRQRLLLTELDEKQATLVGTSGASRIARKLLARLWTGEFELVWRMNAGVALIHRGMRGDAVVWLRQHLARAMADAADAANDADGAAQAPVSRYFGSGVESRVRNFQLMNGLKPDGLVGPRTQILLNGLTPEPGVPTLTPAPDAKK